MRIVRYLYGKKTAYGILKDDTVHGLRRSPFGSADSVFSLSGDSLPLNEVKLLAPCMPSKVVCLGVNYRPHAREMGSDLPAQPLIFLKPASAVIGPGDNIVLPRDWQRVDYEAELAVVIGRQARYIEEKQALDYVLGYTCFNDVTERVCQKIDGQWTRAKGFDTFAPIGPWIETELDPHDLQLAAVLNNKVCQSARTSELLFGIEKLISFISGVMTLKPGDVIATGTPAGIGGMQPGDTIEIKIEGIGTLQNRVAPPL
jgi:2-keto-4-pentenoate hydratase/2-oxohepta-3-ene-1,7-dioic acid hydratase in catechol pathway